MHSTRICRMTKENRLASAKALGHSIGAIEQAVGRPKSTISRELSRNKLPSWQAFHKTRRRSL